MAAFPEPRAEDEVLNSWIDIAKYLNRGVRTVQRWEIELALPVHRPRGRSRGVVWAARSELDRWLTECPTGAGEAQMHAAVQSDGNRRSHQTSNLVSESQNLRTDLARLRNDLTILVNRLTATVQCWRPELMAGRSSQAA